MGDNFSVRVASSGRDHFDAAVKLAWAGCVGKVCEWYVLGVPEHRCEECFGKGTRTMLRPIPEGKRIDGNKDWVEVGCTECSGKKIVPAQEAFILLWSEESVRGVKATKLPYPLTRETAPEFLWNWLKTAKFPDEPDQDGSNSEGFIVTTGNFWGHVEESHYAFLGVYPDWQMHGK